MQDVPEDRLGLRYGKLAIFQQRPIDQPRRGGTDRPRRNLADTRSEQLLPAPLPRDRDLAERLATERRGVKLYDHNRVASALARRLRHDLGQRLRQSATGRNLSESLPENGEIALDEVGHRCGQEILERAEVIRRGGQWNRGRRGDAAMGESLDAVVGDHLECTLDDAIPPSPVNPSGRAGGVHETMLCPGLCDSVAREMVQTSQLGG